MRTLLFACAVLHLSATTADAAPPIQAKQYDVRLALHERTYDVETNKATERTLAEPRLMVAEGRPAAFHVGGKIGAAQLPVGTTVKVNVKEADGEHVLVAGSIEVSTGREEDGVVLAESTSAHFTKKLQRGRRVKIMAGSRPMVERWLEIEVDRVSAAKGRSVPKARAAAAPDAAAAPRSEPAAGLR